MGIELKRKTCGSGPGATEIQPSTGSLSGKYGTSMRPGTWLYANR